MARRSFRRRIVALLVAALGVVQLLTLAAVLIATQRNVEHELAHNLTVAESLFTRLYDARFSRLVDSVQVLAGDFGFKQAMATADAATIASVLENHGARAKADLALLVDLTGAIVASTGGGHDALAANASWRSLVQQVRKDDHGAATIGIGRRAYQLVAVPVTAPETIGWLFMGFAVDDALANELKRSTGLEVSFLTGGAPPTLLASTHSIHQHPALAAAIGALPTRAASNSHDVQLGDEHYLTRRVALTRSDGTVMVVLQQSLTSALRPYQRLAWQLTALFALVLSAALAAGIYLARSITAPVQQLASAAERIGEGNYAVDIAVHGDDELAQLAATLNGMQFEIAEREHRIVHQAHHDDLTGLPNRWLANDRLQGAIARAARSGKPFSVALLDLARFKQINDSLGHHVGDVVLRETARRIAARARRADTIARLGGDDFLLILEGADGNAARAILGILRHTLTAPIELEGMSVTLDFRAGLAIYPEHGEDATSLMRRAEIAMYDAKDAREWLVTYRAGRDDGHLRQLAIVATLPAALAGDELTLHYQPKAALDDGGVHQAEALIRWVHPRFGFLPPDEFIGVIEQSGNIGLLTAWLIGRAARQCHEWRQRGLEIKICLNLSALDLLNDALPDLLANTLEQYRLPAAMIGLEITESAVMRDPATALAVLARLRAAGHRISIDDFGTGYSSLAQLKRMPVDELKIDKSFVLNLSASSDDAVIVKSTIDLAHTLGLEVVAEGVETAAAWHTLTTFGCDIAQGYLIAKPLPAPEFERWARANGQRFSPWTENAA